MNERPTQNFRTPIAVGVCNSQKISLKTTNRRYCLAPADNQRRTVKGIPPETCSNETKNEKNQPMVGLRKRRSPMHLVSHTTWTPVKNSLTFPSQKPNTGGRAGSVREATPPSWLRPYGYTPTALLPARNAAIQRCVCTSVIEHGVGNSALIWNASLEILR